jgi:hypothetical protein
VASTIAGLLGALIGVLGVALGAWLNGRRDDRKWLRDQKLRAAAEFITAAGQLFDHRRSPDPHESTRGEHDELTKRVQSGRSTIHLLCGSGTVELADQLARRVYRTTPDVGDDYRDSTIGLLIEFTDRLRVELGSQRRPSTSGR